LLDAPDGMIEAMLDVLQQRAEAQRKALKR
jgi:hypothetical protein